MITSTRALAVAAAFALAVTMSDAAHADSQSGGLPALDGRVTTLETSVATQGASEAAVQAQVGTLQGQVGTLQGQLSTLQGQLATLQTRVATLEGRPTLFALVNSDGTLRASNGVLFSDHARDSSSHPFTGLYTVFFTRDVSLCAVTATAEPEYNGRITANINGTFRGISNPFFRPNEFLVSFFDEDGNFIDVRFNLVVAC
jgi:uncharacterized coiled-coil protein SlyX